MGAQDWSPTPLSEGPDIFRCTRERGHVHPLRQMYDTKRTVTGELTLVAGKGLTRAYTCAVQPSSHLPPTLLSTCNVA